MKKLILSCISLLFCFTASYAQTENNRKVIREVKNEFVDRQADWKRERKNDYGVWGYVPLTTSLAGNILTINNKGTTYYYGVDLAVNDNHEGYYWEYKNCKISVKVNSLSKDKSKYYGLGIEALGATNNVSTHSYIFLVNGLGEARIIQRGPEDYETKLADEKTVFQSKPLESFVADQPNLITTERLGPTWNFYVNDKLIFSQTDATLDNLFTIEFNTEGGAKATFDSPNLIFYE
ncbi:MAG: hypothetical protein ACXWDO_05245 [Bacteroidia bacterium]